MKQSAQGLGHEADPYSDTCKVCGLTRIQIVQMQVSCEEAQKGKVLESAVSKLDD